MSEHSHAAVHSEAHHVSLATYIAVFVALMVLLVATIAVTYVDVGRWNIIIALAIAIAKAALIVTYFMHIRYADGGEELYDEKADKLEWKNLASDPQYAAVKQDLAKWFPKTNVATPRAVRGKDAETEKKGKRNK